MNEFTRKAMELADEMAEAKSSFDLCQAEIWRSPIYRHRMEREYESTKARLLAHLEGAEQKWRPIETAPKDGTAVLVMLNVWPGCRNGVAEECNGHNTYVAEWWSGERDGAGAWMCYMDSCLDPECPIEPTHWMPLPATPTEEQP
jgi:hypothetical protein